MVGAISDYVEMIGAELTVVNGLAADSLLSLMLQAIPSDADLVSRKLRWLEDPFRFGDLYSQLFGVTRSFQLTLNGPGEGVAGEAIVSGVRRPPPRESDRHGGTASATPITVTIYDDVARLLVRSFGPPQYERAGINFADFLRTTFQELADKEVSSLIVDLRENRGGADQYGKVLFAHFVDTTFSYYQSLTMNDSAFSFAEYTAASVVSMDPVRLSRNASGTFDLSHENMGPQLPRNPYFGGDILLLVGGNTFSAAAEFAALMRHARRATLIGEDAGGGYRGNTSGAYVELTLPNTRVRLRIPLVRYEMAVAGTDRAITPECHAKTELADILAGRDTVFEYARALIDRRRGEPDAVCLESMSGQRVSGS